jgi:hypothetical protein
VKGLADEHAPHSSTSHCRLAGAYRRLRVRAFAGVGPYSYRRLAAPALHDVRVGHPYDGVTRGFGTYVLIKPKGDSWETALVDTGRTNRGWFVNARTRLASEGELLFVSEDLKYVSVEFARLEVKDSDDESHCGLVIEVKPPLVKLQTMIGEYWMRVEQVYARADHGCQFVNGQYRD